MAELVLSIGAREIAGWQEVRISRAIDRLAHAFQLGLAIPGRLPAGITEGAACSLCFGRELLLTGFIDSVEPSYDVEAHSVEVSGRSRAGDLVDCSALHDSGEWLASNLCDIAGELVRPFGLTIEASRLGAEEPFAFFALEQGEEAGAAIERAARQRAVLVTSSPGGNLRFTRGEAGASVGTLRRGENILRGRGRGDWSQRFSEYVVRAQSRGGDQPSAGGVEARAVDADVRRHRPLVVVAEEPGDADALQERAEWEARVRAARSRRVEYTVRGWTHPGGRTWAPGQTVTVDDDFLRASGPWLVASAVLSLNSEGTLTTLELAPPHAFDVMRAPEGRRDQL